MTRFHLLTSLPDGHVLHDGPVDQPPSALQKGLQGAIVADGTSNAQLQTKFGKLRIDWNADAALGIGSATLWREDKLAMTMVYMAGSSPKALETARVFTRVWDDNEVVKQSAHGKPRFTPLLDTLARPFGLAVNWATMSAADLTALGEPEIAIGAAFFENLAANPPRADSPGLLKRLFGRK